MLENILSSIGAKESNSIFRPVRCYENDIENKPSVNGFLYFNMDTKKIYYGIQEGKY